MLKDQYDILIVGAGPAGLMAAIESAIRSRSILILEKMHTPAMKLKISGKGRCNITNSADREDFISHFGKNGRFLKYAFAEFFNTDLLQYFEKHGVHFKLERGGRYFPQNDDALDIVKALLDKIKSLHITLSTHSEVIGIEKVPHEGFIVSIKKKQSKLYHHMQIKAHKIVIATGGKSYPGTGSTGIGYKIASRFGHTIKPITPSLVPVVTRGNIAKRLQGLSLRNVNASVWCNNKKRDEQFGEMVFTDFGLSGPIILSLSRPIVKLIDGKENVVVSIDLKPALDQAMLDRRLLREIHEHSLQSFKSLLKKLLPRKLVSVFIEMLNIPEEKRLNQLLAEERKRLLSLLKDFSFEVVNYKPIHDAIVTSGGVCVKEIHSQTMESKLVQGLYFAGEVIDVDADTGGFNLQAAFSTGWVAGRAINLVFG